MSSDAPQPPAPSPPSPEQFQPNIQPSERDIEFARIEKRNAELEATVERLQRNEQNMPENTRVGNAIEEAAALLPAGWNILIDVENGAAGVELESPDGNRKFSEGEFLSDMIRDAIQSAIKAAEAAGGDS